MNIRPIKTEADYQTALREIEKLFDAAANTPEGDHLEVLAALVEAYEERHFSIPASDPNEEPRVMLQDPESYKNMRNAIDILKLITLGEEDIKNSRSKSQEKTFAHIEGILKEKRK
jgi:HTH-type transcriptional regulator/antitoxin HigA